MNTSVVDVADGRGRSALVAVAAALVAGAWIAALLSAPGVTAGGLARYLAGFLFLVVLPASALVRRICPELSALERVAVAVPLGIAVVTTLYWFVRLAGWPGGEVAGAAVLGAVALFEVVTYRRRRGADADGAPWHLPIVIALLGAVLAALVGGGFFAPLVEGAGGSLWYRDIPIDVRFHAVLTSEVVRSVPPQAPYFAGYALNYHYFVDLFAVVMQRVSGLPLFPLIAGLQFSVFLIALVLAATTFTATLTKSAFATAAAVGLILFGGGPFNVVLGPLALPAGRVWDHIFHGQSAMALFTMNPQIIGLALLCAGLKVAGAPSVRWPRAVLAGFLLGAACAFKMFLGLLAVGALIGAYMLRAFDRTPRLDARVVIAAVAWAALFAGYFFAVNAGSGSLSVQLRPGWFVLFGLEYLGLASWRDAAAQVYAGEMLQPAAVLAGVALLVALVIGNVGYRLPALGRLWRSIFDDSFERRTVALMFWGGLAIFLFVELKPADWPNWYNNAGWFHHAGLSMAAIVVAEHWGQAREQGRRGLRLAYAVLAAAAAASMVQFFYATARAPYAPVPRADVEALDFVRNRLPADGVVLVNANPYEGGYPFIEMLGERRVYLGPDWAQASVRKVDSDRRVAEVKAFFSNPHQGRAVLRDGITHVWADDQRDATLIAQAGGGTGCAHPPAGTGLAELQCVFGNGRYTIYRVTEAGE